MENLLYFAAGVMSARLIMMVVFGCLTKKWRL